MTLAALIACACAGADGDPAPTAVDGGAPAASSGCDDAGAHE
jgi:hypothetical protein